MMRVARVRIDDRLIHGQVVVKWLRYLDCKQILIVDDELWRDDFMQSVLRLAAPSEVRVHVAPVRQAAKLLQSSTLTLREGEASSDAHGALVLVRSPQTALALLDNGILFSELNVGALAAGEGTTRLYKSVSANSEQIAALCAMQDRGVRVYFQMVPEERPMEMSELLPVRQPQ
jgi:mannose/fructose/N-acetylgalactosamine-specific phosphotransferase system component IIB